MKSLYIIIFLFAYNTYMQGQRIDAYWMMGYGNEVADSNWWGANVIFDSVGIKEMNVNHRIMNIEQSFSAIADTRGSLLFYTNGTLVANKANDTIGQLYQSTDPINDSSNGNTALAMPISAIILPVPNDSNTFYLFNFGYEYIYDYPYQNVKGYNLYCSLLDKRLNNNNGGIVYKSTAIINDTLAMGGLSAVKHANGRDWWVVMPTQKADEIYVSLVTQNSVSSHLTQLIGVPHVHALGENGNQAFFLRDGTKYLRVEGQTQKIYIMDFDRCNGTFSTVKTIPTPTQYALGLVVSANGNILYSSEDGIHIYQYDLTATDIAASKTLIAVHNGAGGMFGGFVYGYLAPDDRIYFVDNTNTLTVINHPNVWGLGCDVQQHSITIPTINGNTVPNYPNFYLGPLVGSGCDTLTSIKEEGIRKVYKSIRTLQKK